MPHAVDLAHHDTESWLRARIWCQRHLPGSAWHEDGRGRFSFAEAMHAAWFSMVWQEPLP